MTSTTCDAADRAPAPATLSSVERERVEPRLQAAFDVCPVAMAMIDRGGTIHLINREAERLFGYSREELLGQAVEVLVPHRFRRRHPELREAFFRAPEARRLGDLRELFAMRKDGSEFPVEIGLSPLAAEEGLLAFAAIVDVTAKVEARRRIERYVAELQRSNQELDQFACIASHDLQEPLRKIAGCCQVLAEDYGPQLDEQAREWIAFAVDGAERMRRLIADLLAYSRIGTRGKQVAPTDAAAACAAAIDNLAAAIEEAGATVHCHPLPRVMADDTQLAQVFQNLIGNALKYRGQSAPLVEVGCRPQDHMVEFYVRDNGIGIDPQFHERIFDVFQRLHRRDEYSGTGVGLAICKKAVERMGGRIWVESQPGAGSTFYFTLAAASRPEAGK